MPRHFWLPSFSRSARLGQASQRLHRLLHGRRADESGAAFSPSRNHRGCDPALGARGPVMAHGHGTKCGTHAFLFCARAVKFRALATPAFAHDPGGSHLALILHVRGRRVAVRGARVDALACFRPLSVFAVGGRQLELVVCTRPRHSVRGMAQQDTGSGERRTALHPAAGDAPAGPLPPLAALRRHIAGGGVRARLGSSFVQGRARIASCGAPC